MCVFTVLTIEKVNLNLKQRANVQLFKLVVLHPSMLMFLKVVLSQTVATLNVKSKDAKTEHMDSAFVPVLHYIPLTLTTPAI